MGARKRKQYARTANDNISNIIWNNSLRISFMGDDMKEIILKSKSNKYAQIAVVLAVVIIFFLGSSLLNSVKQDATTK
jgi:hypothetical protein